jgi:hypothetical protein
VRLLGITPRRYRELAEHPIGTGDAARCRPAAVRFSGPPSLAIDTHSTEGRIISSDSTRKLSRQLRRDSGVVEEERQVRSHAFTAGEYAQAVE